MIRREVVVRRLRFVLLDRTEAPRNKNKKTTDEKPKKQSHKQAKNITLKKYPFYIKNLSLISTPSNQFVGKKPRKQAAKKLELDEKIPNEK